MNVFRRSRAITASLGMAIIVAGCTGGDDGDGAYTMGVSNTLTGNGWREEMICSINAQAAVSGEVESLTSATATRMPPVSSRTSATSSPRAWTRSS